MQGLEYVFRGVQDINKVRNFANLAVDIREIFGSATVDFGKKCMMRACSNSTVY